MSIRSPILSASHACPRWAIVAAFLSVGFGLLTVIVGGRALFGDAAARVAVGNAVPFVLWFNFLCGFAYVAAGIGLYRWTRWAALLSAAIAVSTLVVFGAFLSHIALGGLFETRTIGAMILRSTVWCAIAIPACRSLACGRA